MIWSKCLNVVVQVSWITDIWYILGDSQYRLPILILYFAIQICPWSFSYWFNWQLKICTCHASLPNSQATFVPPVSHKQATDTILTLSAACGSLLMYISLFTVQPAQKFDFQWHQELSLSSSGPNNALAFVEEKWHSVNQSNVFRVRIESHWHCVTKICAMISDFHSDFSCFC